MADQQSSSPKNKFEMLKMEIRAILVSAKGGLSPAEVDRDYFDINGRYIPFLTFGFPTLFHLLDAMSDTVGAVQSDNGQVKLFAKPSEHTHHLEMLIANQKNALKVGRFGGVINKPAEECHGTRERRTLITNRLLRLFASQPPNFIKYGHLQQLYEGQYGEKLDPRDDFYCTPKALFEIKLSDYFDFDDAGQGELQVRLKETARVEQHADDRNNKNPVATLSSPQEQAIAQARPAMRSIPVKVTSLPNLQARVDWEPASAEEYKRTVSAGFSSAARSAYKRAISDVVTQASNARTDGATDLTTGGNTTQLPSGGDAVKKREENTTSLAFGRAISNVATQAANAQRKGEMDLPAGRTTMQLPTQYNSTTKAEENMQRTSTNITTPAVPSQSMDVNVEKSVITSPLSVARLPVRLEPIRLLSLDAKSVKSTSDQRRPRLPALGSKTLMQCQMTPNLNGGILSETGSPASIIRRFKNQLRHLLTKYPNGIELIAFEWVYLAACGERLFDGGSNETKRQQLISLLRECSDICKLSTKNGEIYLVEPTSERPTYVAPKMLSPSLNTSYEIIMDQSDTNSETTTESSAFVNKLRPDADRSGTACRANQNRVSVENAVAVATDPEVIEVALDQLKQECRKVLHACPSGVTYLNFQRAYKEITGKNLNLAPYGFLSVSELAETMPELFVMENTKDGVVLKERQVLSNAKSNQAMIPETKQDEHEDEIIDSSRDELMQLLWEIVMMQPTKSIFLDQIPAVYKKATSRTFPVEDLGKLGLMLFDFGFDRFSYQYSDGQLEIFAEPEWACSQ